MLAPLLVAMPLVGVLANIGQVGFILSGKSMMPDFERINPLSGFKRMFSMRTVVELVKTHRQARRSSAGCSTAPTWTRSPVFLSLAGADLAGALRPVREHGLLDGHDRGRRLPGPGALDYGYQRWEFLRGAG